MFQTKKSIALKSSAVLLAVLLLAALAPVLGGSVYADVSGVYTYEVTDGEVTITAVDTGASGALTRRSRTVPV